MAIIYQQMIVFYTFMYTYMLFEISYIPISNLCHYSERNKL